jgi:hypothetical protein
MTHSTATDAQIFLREIQGFFFSYFGNFEFYSPPDTMTNYAYFYNYRAYGLSIVVFLPIIRNKSGDLTLTQRKIIIALKKTGVKKRPYLIELTDTILTKNWQDRVRERISTLRELVAEIHKCKICDAYQMPRVMRTADLKRTMFVQLQCPTCHKYTPTIFGRGLKTRLHRNLKRTREE